MTTTKVNKTEYISKNMNRLRETMSATKIVMMQNPNTRWMASSIFAKDIGFEDSEMNTACTDGTVIRICPMFWLEGCTTGPIQYKTTPGMRLTILFHEDWHGKMGHCDSGRVAYFDAYVWNIAGDTQIAGVRAVSGIGEDIPGTINATNSRGDVELTINGKKLTIQDAHKKCVEEIYYIIMNHIRQNPGGGRGGHVIQEGQPNDQPGDGEGDGNSKGKGNKPDIRQNGKKVGPMDELKTKEFTPTERNRQKDKLREAYVQNKARGTLPGWAEVALEAELSEKVDYKSELRDFVTPEIKAYTTFSRSCRRTFATIIPDVVFPGSKREGLTVGIYIDTSGSIGTKEAKAFLGEIKSLFKQYDPGMVRAVVRMHDVEVYAEHEINNTFELDELTIRGGGGTSHLDAFKKAEEDGQEVCIFLTDGYSEFPTETKVRKCLWIVTDKSGATMIPDNLGKRIVIDVNEL